MRDWLDEDDPRPAREQLDERYQFAGSWRQFNGFTMSEGGMIKFPAIRRSVQSPPCSCATN